jgi:hypothetical protein
MVADYLANRSEHRPFSVNPRVDAFVTMLRDPVYRDAVEHRRGAVADARLIRLESVGAGACFGEFSGSHTRSGADVLPGPAQSGPLRSLAAVRGIP